MKKFELALFGFFLLFNTLFIFYTIATGFDWSKVLVPAMIVVVCMFFIRSILKELRQSK